MPNPILGISAYYHDSAAVLLTDGQITAAAQEERFTRKKHDSAFPTQAVRYVLEEAGVDLNDLTAIAFYDKPFLKFERLLETYHAFAPRGLRSFLSAIPVWIKEKLFMRRMLWKELSEIGPGRPTLLFPEHHLSHAASAFYPSPFDRAAILTVDGVGEWATTTIGRGDGNTIEILLQLDFPHSLGLLYSAFTAFCGFRVNSGEYKLMGLAPYGNTDAARTKAWKQAIYESLADVREDGSFLLNMDYFDYATGLTMYNARRWEQLFGIPPRKMESELAPEYMDLALAIQQVTEEIMLRLAQTARKITGCPDLVLAGGVALNCVSNGKLLRKKLFDDIWIQPAAGDAGGALGAAYTAWHIRENQARPSDKTRPDAMQGAYLGPEFSYLDTQRTARKYDAPYHRYTKFSRLCADVAARMADGKVVGWFQDRMEYGPRALGNRSIVGDPRNPAMQKLLNLKIKYREGFRPFAPSVLEEEISTYFDLDCVTPYMLLVAPVKAERRNPLPQGDAGLDLYTRLYHLRSDIPAVTHVDYSARIQSVSKATNPRYWELINAFKTVTGYGVIVNTSFNVRGEPIVRTPEDAFICFMRTEMDYLVIGDFLFDKKEQQALRDDMNWRDEYELD